MRPLHSLAAAFSLALGLTTAQAAPTMTLNPAIGPPTGNVKVAIGGYKPWAEVTVFFDYIGACLIMTNGKGKGTCSFKVPSAARPQGHWISAIQESTNTGTQRKFTVRTDWAQFHGNSPGHDGFNPFENTISQATAPDLELMWRKAVPNVYARGAVVYGGRVYLAGLDHKLHAFDALTGASAAGFPRALNGAVTGTPAAGGGRIFVATDAPDNRLYAFNAKTGAPIAGYPKTLAGPVRGSPLYAYGNVYVATDITGRLHGFAGATGAALPGFPKVINPSKTTPVATHGNVFVTDTIAHLWGFDALSGASLSHLPGNYTAAPGMSPIAASGMVFVGDGGGHVRAVEHGGPFGQDVAAMAYDVGQAFGGTPAAARGHLVVAARYDANVNQPGRLRFYTIATSQHEKDSTGYSPLFDSSPVIANDIIFAADSTWVRAFSAQTGSQLWSHQVNTLGVAPLAVANGILYVMSNDNHLYAFSVDGLPPGVNNPKAPELARLRKLPAQPRH